MALFRAEHPNMKPELWQLPEPSAEALAALPQRIAELAARLQEIATHFPQAAFASSLAAEDAVLADQIAELSLPFRVFTLDTGRLNAETAALIGQTQSRYPQIFFQIFTPEHSAVEAFDHEYGAGAMYESTALRKRCCTLRKIEPLNRALAHAPAWLTGQRRSQSSTRSGLQFAEHDGARGIAKFNPLFDWEDDDVWAYVQTHDVPLNALYRQGYPSIGCEPCTRPVKAGEDIRAGRWWWEQQDSRECGLHR